MILIKYSHCFVTNTTTHFDFFHHPEEKSCAYEMISFSSLSSHLSNLYFSSCLYEFADPGYLRHTFALCVLSLSYSCTVFTIHHFVFDHKIIWQINCRILRLWDRNMKLLCPEGQKVVTCSIYRAVTVYQAPLQALCR